MSLINKVKANFKSVPKKVYLAAAIIPFGFVALGTFFIGKTAYDYIKPKSKSLREETQQMLIEERNK